MQSLRRKGQILHFGRQGFGHLVDDATREHIFFHISDFTPRRSTVGQDDWVTYELIHPAKGPRAIKIQIVAVATKNSTTEMSSENPIQA